MIVCISYLEPEFQQTLRCLDKVKGVDIVIVNRQPPGVGSLAEAINRGFKQVNDDPFVWFVTNITFQPDVYHRLCDSIGSHAAIQPVYSSDHLHLRPATRLRGVKQVPCVEFTCPLVRSGVFREFPLDEDMPYVYHDLDWSHRVKQVGHTVAVDQRVQIGHTYIRHFKTNHPITWMRKKLRDAAMKPSQDKCKKKYGTNWSKIIWEH
jgi:hypothetical protein